MTGVDSLLRLRLAYYTLGINASRLLAKNDILYRFLNAKTFTGSNPLQSNKNNSPNLKVRTVILAGVAGFEPTNAAVKVLCLTA